MFDDESMKSFVDWIYLIKVKTNHVHVNRCQRWSMRKSLLSNKKKTQLHFVYIGIDEESKRIPGWYVCRLGKRISIVGWYEEEESILKINSIFFLGQWNNRNNSSKKNHRWSCPILIVKHSNRCNFLNCFLISTH